MWETTERTPIYLPLYSKMFVRRVSKDHSSRDVTLPFVCDRVSGSGFFCFWGAIPVYVYLGFPLSVLFQSVGICLLFQNLYQQCGLIILFFTAPRSC